VLDDARPHTAAATVNYIATFGWERLDHAAYSPDLVLSDFQFFPTLERTLMLVKRWDRCIKVGGDCVEK
jgi:hypothetical protein